MALRDLWPRLGPRRGPGSGGPWPGGARLPGATVERSEAGVPPAEPSVGRAELGSSPQLGPQPGRPGCQLGTQHSAFGSQHSAHSTQTFVEPVIQAHGVRKVYHGGAHQVEALRGVDLAVLRGEMVAIMGPSGCGKTTLLNCLSGLDDVDGGDVLIEGVSLARMGDRERTDYRAKRMGFIFQSFNLLPVLSAVENVELPLLLTGQSPRRARERALEMLSIVGLADRAGHRPSELSGGQQQRAAVARALTTSPAIIWADEPTGNLDSESAAIVMDLMVRLNRENGETFVLVTHAREVADRAHRIVHMRDGRITSYQPSAVSPQETRVSELDRRRLLGADD
jgi:ABC-type lipoprotein export system ATPase subunit